MNLGLGIVITFLGSLFVLAKLGVRSTPFLVGTGAVITALLIASQ